MATIDELAKWLGGTRLETSGATATSQTITINGKAVADSENGSVSVYIGSDTLGGDGTAYVEIPCTTNVQEGDDVIITMSGDGGTKNPVVTGVVGSGDRTAGQIQYFWSDDDGAHIATSRDASSGPNLLATSGGVYMRIDNIPRTAQTQDGFFVLSDDGEADLFSVSDEAIALNQWKYDEVSQTYTLQPVFLAAINDARDPYFQIGTRSEDSVRPGGYSATIGQGLINRGYGMTVGRWNSDPGAYYAFVIGNGTGPNNRSDAFKVSNNGAVDAAGAISGASISTTGNATIGGTLTVGGEQVLMPTVLFTGSATGNVTLSQSAANFQYLEIFYKDTDNIYDSVRVDSPNTKTISLSTANSYTQSATPFGGFSIKARTVEVNGTSIKTRSQYGYDWHGEAVGAIGGTMAPNRGTYISITKVVGYK